jgi:hypothetical protein
MQQPVTMDAAPLSPPPPSRYPDDADLALARVATPWVGRYHTGGNWKLAEALTAWLTARGIY